MTTERSMSLSCLLYGTNNKNKNDFKLLFALFSQARNEGGARVCGDAVLRYFWCGFTVIFILTRGIAVSKH